MALVNISVPTNATFVPVDTRTNNLKVVLLPTASTMAGRLLTIKDYYGSANVSSFTVSTTGTDYLEGNAVRMTMSNTFATLSLVSDGFRTWSPYSFYTSSYVPFSPLQIGGLIIWMDAADPTTIATSGSAVTTWRSKGLSNLTATSATGTITNGLAFKYNTSNVIRFNATSFLTMTGVTIPNSERSLFYIFSVTSYGDGYSSIIRSSTNTGSNQWGFQAWNRDGNTLLIQRGDGTQGVYVNSTAPFSGTLPYDATPFFVSIVNSAARTAISANGTEMNSLAVGSQKYATYRTTSDTFHIGQAQYANVLLVGEILEYAKPLSVYEVNQVEGYLAWKWGAQSNLPTTHPFRYSRP
jgi:hypothetical protein